MAEARTTRTGDSTKAGPDADTPQKTAAVEPVNGPGGGTPAGESTDPVVQQILAERDIARQNEDDDAVNNYDKRLRELGYTVA